MANERKAQRFIKKASELREIATNERDPVIRQVLLDLAQHYDDMAAEAAPQLVAEQQAATPPGGC